jgi:hypothetical protein
MMGDVHEHGEQDFAAGEAAVGGIVDFIELVFGQIGDDRGTIVERTAQELDDGVFVLVGGGREVGSIDVF